MLETEKGKIFQLLLEFFFSEKQCHCKKTKITILGIDFKELIVFELQESCYVFKRTLGNTHDFDGFCLAKIL